MFNCSSSSQHCFIGTRKIIIKSGLLYEKKIETFMSGKTGFDDIENPIMVNAEDHHRHCGMYISFSQRDTRKYVCQSAKNYGNCKSHKL